MNIKTAINTHHSALPHNHQKIAIAVHVYYQDLWPEIASYLQNIDYPYDLFITTTDEQFTDVCALVKQHFPLAYIRALPNRGMDILPFLSLMPELTEAGYVAVCKLHTKQGHDELAGSWRKLMLDTLVGNTATIAAVTQALADDGQLAMVGPGALYLSVQKLMYAQNQDNIELLARAVGISSLPQDWGFFAGTMFWVRPALLRTLAEQIRHVFEGEAVQKHADGGLEHALERLLGFLPVSSQQKLALLLPGTGSRKQLVLQKKGSSRTISQAYTKEVLQQYQRLTTDRTCLIQSGLFDNAAYLQQFPELLGCAADLPSHYLLIGHFQQATPHPDFDPRFYTQQYGAHFVAGESPFLHYLREEAKAGYLLQPSKQQEMEEIPNFHYRALKVQSFKSILEKPHDIDNSQKKAELIDHVTRIITQIKTPIEKLAFESFDIKWYLNKNKDLSGLNINLYEHYVNHGIKENRHARYINLPKEIENLVMTENKITLNNIKNQKKNVYFYANDYLAANTDLAALFVEPFIHYVKHGYKENRLLYPIGTSTNSENIRIVQEYDGSYHISVSAQKYSYLKPKLTDSIQKDIQQFKKRPFFSIVVPIYNTPDGLLEKLFYSVQQQWYENWELILIDDASTTVNIRKALDIIKTAQNTKVIHLQHNHRIAGATNIGIQHASGDYIVFLDHDDELTVDCLYELAACINRENSDYIYSDEDKISPEGYYCDPHFKPSWSPDTLMSTMYVCHVSCIKKELLDEVGKLRSEYDGCQDWDLMLRITEKAKTISHIPKVLYHWRIIPQSIAADISAKPYVVNASHAVREQALQRRGLKGHVEQLDDLPGYFNINYLPKTETKASIIIPTRDNPDLLRRCIHSIEKQKYPINYEIIIIDNGSILDSTLSFFNELKANASIKVVRHDIAFNFSKLCNLGAQIAEGDSLVFLNDDTEVITPDWLQRLIGYAQLSHIGAVGAKLLYPNGNIQHAGILNLKDGPGHAFIGNTPESHGYYLRNRIVYNWIALTGACLAIERDKFDKIGGFDEGFPIAYNDIDLCFSLLNLKFFNVVCPNVKLIHHESVSRGIDDIDPEKLGRLKSERKKLYNKHPHFFGRDPFYSINLHPNGINFDLP